MNVLVVFATKTGVTEAIAQRLKNTCKQTLKLRSVKACKEEDLQAAQAIILGTGVYIGRLHRKMRNFIKKHVLTLVEKPLIMYICAGEPEENMADVLTNSMPKQVHEHTTHIFHAGGQFRYDAMKPLSRWIIKTAQKSREDAQEPSLNEENIKALIHAIDTL